MDTRLEIRTPLLLESAEELRRLRDEAIANAREELAREAPEEREVEGLTRIALAYDRARLYAFPKDRADWDAVHRARLHREEMQQAEAPLPGGVGRWSFVGPRAFADISGAYCSGRVNTIAIDPKNPKILFAGSAGGGVWKTTDGGTNWTPLSDTWPFNDISSIAIDPKNSSVIYVGTGDFPGWSVRHFGLMKSTDGGASFTNIPGGEIARSNISSIIVDPDDSNVVTICGGRGGGDAVSRLGFVWRSTDAGATWTRAINVGAEWSKLAVGIADTSGNRVMYATGWDGTPNGILMRSLDRGATWTPLTVPWAPGQFGTSVAASLLDPRRVYVLAGADRMVLMSTDAGTSWTNVTDDLRRDDFEYSQLWYDWDLACGSSGGASPHDVLFVGLLHLNFWDAALRKWIGIPHGHDDVHGITVDPANPNHFFAGNDGGVYEGVRDATGNWTIVSLNKSLGVTETFRGHASLHDPRICIAGTQDNAVPSSQTDPANWRQLLPPAGGDAITGYVSPADPKVQFCEGGVAFYGIGRTGDQWASGGVDVTPPIGSDFIDAFSTPLAMDEAGSKLYWGTDYLWIRSEATGTWTARVGGQKLAGDRQAVRTIALAPSDASRVYTGSTDGQVWMNAAGTWTRIDMGLPVRLVSAIAVHPKNADDVLVALGGTGSGHIFRCRNTRASTLAWENVSGSGTTGLPDLPAAGIVRDPRDPNEVFYAALDVGVFVTFNGGASWTDITTANGLPNAQISSMRLVGRNIYAFTFGRGIWRLPLPMTRITPASASIGDTLFVASTSIDGRILLCKAKFGSAFSAWHQVGGNGRTDVPVALASFENTLFIFAKGLDGKLYLNQADLTTTNQDIDKFVQSFSGWFPVPGGFTTDAAPAAVRVGPSLFVFIRTPDGRIFFNQAEYRKSFVGWFELPGGGRTNVSPACATIGDVVFVFIRNAGDGKVLVNQAQFGHSFSGWFEVQGGGVATTAPAAAVVDRTVFVFIRDGAGRILLNQADYGHAFGSWFPVPGMTTALAPGASSVLKSVFAFALDSGSQIRVAQAPIGSAFSAWFPMPDDAP